jgi:hypothetical protein
LWASQPRHVGIWVEKDALAAVFVSTAVGASLADDKFQARLANIGATALARRFR